MPSWLRFEQSWPARKNLQGDENALAKHKEIEASRAEIPALEAELKALEAEFTTAQPKFIDKMASYS